MRQFVLLDSGPLGQACRRYGVAAADQCRLWIDSLVARAVEVVVPEVADYEVRRELTRLEGQHHHAAHLAFQRPIRPSRYR
jgi:hypothetical protein